jgi:cysteine synthase
MKSIKSLNSPCLKGLIGNTPLIKISPHIYAKLETYSPAGSVKDRMVQYVVERSRIFGKIDEDSILCEATSGNTGIALSMMAASLGIQCVIFMPSNMSEERRQMMKIYGAKIIDAPPSDFQGAIAMRDQYLLANKNAWSPKQFSNNYNTLYHQTTTAPEIHKQVIDTNHGWSAFVHGAGTGGTIEGLRKYIVNNNLKTKICLTRPKEEKHGIQGIGDGNDFLFNPENADRIIEIKTKEAIARAKRFARETGILVGISSGANILASEKYFETMRPSGIIVTMLCDRGERYMSVYAQSD